MWTKDRLMADGAGGVRTAEGLQLEVWIDIRDTLVDIRNTLAKKQEMDIQAMDMIVAPMYEAARLREKKAEEDIGLEDIPEVPLTEGTTVEVSPNLTMTMVSTVEQCRGLTAPPCITGAPEGAPFSIPPDLEARDCENCPIAQNFFDGHQPGQANGSPAFRTPMVEAWCEKCGLSVPHNAIMIEKGGKNYERLVCHICGSGRDVERA